MSLRWTESEYEAYQKRLKGYAPEEAKAGEAVGSVYQRTRSKKRADLGGRFFRSTWEANYARYLNLCGVRWEYEPRIFDFAQIRRGVVDYTPDFYLPDEDRWVEVKGWFSPRDKTKLRRFARFYPEEFKKLTVVIAKLEGKPYETAQALGVGRIESYRDIAASAAGLISTWE